MKVPSRLPNVDAVFARILKTKPAAETTRLLAAIDVVDAKGRYLHWEKLKHIPPVENLTSEEWWAFTKIKRRSLFQVLPQLTDAAGKPFQLLITPAIIQTLFFLEHPFDQLKGSLAHKKKTAQQSLIDEAISSSQLEGASTTRHIAKEMLAQNRPPKNLSEQMIHNNYQAMLFIQDMKEEDLSVGIIKELQRILTRDTLSHKKKSGQFRTSEDRVDVVDMFGEVLHEPPEAKRLSTRLNRLCAFANNNNNDNNSRFMHSIIKGIILHFMLAYEHPFVDGNGRTARALFYWHCAKHHQALMQYLSISQIIRTAPVQYGKAFLHTETDDNDLTYFVLQQLEVITKALHLLRENLNSLLQESLRTKSLASRTALLITSLNQRQVALVQHALRHPCYVYQISEHQTLHGIVYETARTDLLELSDRFKYLKKMKHGKKFVFTAIKSLKDKLKG
ncbi:MAG TPA: Fic family protein [bacterium]|nr:Fic family protein [bacterium]